MSNSLPENFPMIRVWTSKSDSKLIPMPKTMDKFRELLEDKSWIDMIWGPSLEFKEGDNKSE